MKREFYHLSFYPPSSATLKTECSELIVGCRTVIEPRSYLYSPASSTMVLVGCWLLLAAMSMSSILDVDGRARYRSEFEYLNFGAVHRRGSIKIFLRLDFNENNILLGVIGWERLPNCTDRGPGCRITRIDEASTASLER